MRIVGLSNGFISGNFKFYGPLYKIFLKQLKISKLNFH